MKRLLPLLLAASAFAGFPAAAQVNAPTIQIDASLPLTMPDDVYMGEVGGVATNSKGDIFVYTRTGHPFVTLGGARQFAHGGSKLYQFDKNGKFVKEWGHNMYGMMFAAQVRVDPQDNVWVVDQMTGTIMKFDPEAHLVMLLGRKAEAIPFPARMPATPANGANGQPGGGPNNDVFNRPTDVAWDAQGNIFVADGQGNARIAKFTKDGVFVKSWGYKGTENGQFANVRSIAVDAQGNVYAADGGNHRIQVFDNDGNFKTQFTGLGNPQALCLTKGANPVLYVSNSNPPNNIDTAGEIYKMSLDGKIEGKFGRAGKMLKEFGTANAIDCRTDNTLLVGEIGNLRVQKVVLR
jgi:DNA-binding beta-propeller fold protein YncE